MSMHAHPAARLRLTLRMTLPALALLALGACSAGPSYVTINQPTTGFPSRPLAAKGEAAPPTLEEVQGVPVVAAQVQAAEQDRIRLDAMRDAALAYGARAGLARRSYEIAQEVKAKARDLDRVYDFGPLVVPTPGDVGVVMPPTVSEGLDGLAIDDTGTAATASDRAWRIEAPARLVPVKPTWRTYLDRSWQFPDPPPQSLWPSKEEERTLFQSHVAQGWGKGVQQAQRIFETDLARLNRDFQGAARYHGLVAQGIIDKFYVASTDIGVALEEDTLKVGERAVRITSPAGFVPDAARWKPILVTAPKTR
jgi:defect-in-organelle-trafficking protein DotC